MGDLKVGSKSQDQLYKKKGGILIGPGRMGRTWVSLGWKPGTFQIEENGSTKVIKQNYYR